MAKTKVEIFNCRLRLAGNINHDIPKPLVTMREMRLMRAMHGEDSVIEIKPADPAHAEIDEREEYMHLSRQYTNTSDPMSGRKVVEKVFGVELSEYPQWLEDQVELENMEREERSKSSRKEMAELAKQQALDDAKALLKRRGFDFAEVQRA